MKSQKRTHEVTSRALRKGGGRGKKMTKKKKQPTESKEIKGRVRSSTFVMCKPKTVVVGHLPLSETGAALENAVLEYGPVSSVFIPRWANGDSKQIGLVQYEDVEDAIAASTSTTGVKLLDHGQLRSCHVFEFAGGGGVEAALKQNVQDQVTIDALASVGSGPPSLLLRPRMNHQVLCWLPDNVLTSEMLKLFGTIFKVNFVTSVGPNGQYCVKISGGGNCKIAPKVASLLQDGSEMGREAGDKPFGYTLLYVREETMRAEKCAIPFLPKPAKLQQVRSAYGISAVLVREGDLQEGATPAFGVDCKPRPEGGRPRFVGPEDASETDGVLLWGQDHAVTAGLNGLRAVAMDEYDEVVLPLGPFITGKLNLDDITKVCKKGSKDTHFGKAKLDRQAGILRLLGAVRSRQLLIAVVRYLLETVPPSNIGYVEVGDVALMRQLVGTGTLSRLARELQLEDELKVIPLWPCTGVLIVAPERVESSDDDGLHVDEGGLRSMCEAISDDVTEWDKTHFRVQLNAVGGGATRKDVAKGIKPKIVQDLCENVEGLEYLWLDGAMLRGAASETKAIAMKRLYNAIMTKWSELFNLCDLAKAGISIT